ncbi:MAG: hypothetical protein MUP04_10860 [Anaerolineae bacterium]|nr:hypothetical protein [Anaerolineae bacterium]
MRSRASILGYTLLSLILASLLIMLFRGSTYNFLRHWTGEESFKEQIKGLGALLILRLTQPPLETEPYLPIAHTSQNPYGVNTFLEQEVEEAKIRRSLQMIRDAGFHWIRQQFPWEDIEIHGKGDFEDRRTQPSKSAWEKYDRIVELAQEYGVEIIARLDNPPAWSRAQGNEIGTFAPPDDLNDFGDFVYAVVSRYRGRIKYYQIWNEPNIYPEWGEQPVDPIAYTQLLKVGYTRAKEADPGAVIISAGLAPTTEMGPKNLSDLVFLQKMYDAGAKGYFDIMSVQGYGLWTGPDDRRTDPSRTNFSRPRLIREIMVRNGDEDKPIWASEVGWNALPEGFPARPVYGRVSEELQAQYTVRAYERAQEEWPWMGVISYWFFKRADNREKDQPFYYFRLVEPDFTPYPVYWALKELATSQSVVGVGYKQEDHWALAYDGLWEVEFDESASLSAYRVGFPEDTLSFTFRGTDLSLVVVKDERSGILEAVVDGQRRKYNLASPQTQYQVELPIVKGLADGEHRVKITVVSDQVAIDGLIVRRTSIYLIRRSLGLLTVVALLAILGYLLWRPRET